MLQQVYTALAEPTPEQFETLAELLYDAYCASTGGLNFRGEPVPTWQVLPEKQKTAWLATATAAHRAFFHAKMT